MSDDLVSVIMTSYNSNYKFLNKAIKSVLNQTYNNFEFIIVDDGSTNDSLENVIRELINEKNFDKINIIKQDNQGLCNARNMGIKNSKGKYIAFIDDDDIWKENKLEVCYRYFEENRLKDDKLGMIFSQSEIIDENDFVYGIYGFIVKGNIYNKILGKNIIGPPSSVMIDRNVFIDIGNFDPSYIYAEDIELWYRITEKYNVYSLDIPLIKYRYRVNSLSKNYIKMAYYTEKAIKDTLKKVNDKTINKNNILTKYYLDFAYLFFSNNDSKMFKKYYLNCIKTNKRNIINLKLLFGFIISSGGNKVMEIFNKIRRKDIIPPSYLKVYNYLDYEVENEE